SPAPGAASPADPQAVGGQHFGPVTLSPLAAAEPLLGMPAAFLLDPATGLETQLAGLAGWRPVVDPTGRWVVFWSGTLAFDPAGATWRPFQGQLEMASWASVSSAVDAQSGAAAAHALPLGSATDWDLRWDQAGQHLGVWIADANNPGLGSLSLLTIDPATGETSSSAPALLSDAPAARGFALQDGQLVWASPPGQDGTGSRLSILAWSGANAGKTSVQSIENGALIVVH
ncbi:MAG: hypothetical protein ACRDGQ_11430, partial [Candidatus Limnocylindrales bacterium]